MDFFRYRQGRLVCEETDLVGLAAEVGTPVYVYSRGALVERYGQLAGAFAALRPTICFSVKSCSNLGVLRVLTSLGAGLDVVSGGELARARLAGCPPEQIVFAGVGKTEAEIADALGFPDESVTGLAPVDGRQPHAPIGVFNIESEEEFGVLAAAAAALDRRTTAALRVNPDVDAGTHRYTTTGTAENKFGIDIGRAADFFARHAGDRRVRLSGLHVHLGSPVPSVEPYRRAIARVLGLIDELGARGITVDTLDLGGGFAAEYSAPGAGSEATPAGADYAAAIVPMLEDRVRTGGLRVILEPGRFIAAGAGVLLTRVQYVKRSARKRFIICDAGMHTLIRPALYEAYHCVWPATVAPPREPALGADGSSLGARAADLEPCDVVGPICESADFLCQDRPLPPVARGDVLAVFSAGAYGMTMASRYNSHPLPAEVLVDGASASVVRRRETYADLVAHEMPPRVNVAGQ